MAKINLAKIDLSKDRIEPVRDLVLESSGKRLSPSALWRWIRVGLLLGDSGERLRLEAVCISGTWYTSRAAWTEFISRQTAAALGAAQTSSAERSPATEVALRKRKLLSDRPRRRAARSQPSDQLPPAVPPPLENPAPPS